MLMYQQHLLYLTKMITPNKPDFNSRKYYQQLFADVFCSLSDEGTDVENCYQGMIDALQDLLDYHRDCEQRYAELLIRLNKMREL